MSARAVAETAGVGPPEGAATRSDAVARAVESRLVMVRTKLPLSVQRRLHSLTEGSGSSLYMVVRRLLEEGLERHATGSASPAPTAKANKATSSHPPERVSLFLDPQDVRRVEAYAARTGSPKATAFAALLCLGLEVSDEREGIPGSRVDEVRDGLHLVEAVLARIAPAVFGMQVLLAYSVSKAPGIKVTEDEILEQLRLVGEDEWKHAFDEIRQPKQAGE